MRGQILGAKMEEIKARNLLPRLRPFPTIVAGVGRQCHFWAVWERMTVESFWRWRYSIVMRCMKTVRQMLTS